MARDGRSTFVEKWFKRALEANDPFDKFFYAWIAFIIAAQIFRTESGKRVDKDTDGERVADYFVDKKNIILDVLREENEAMLKLARRRGSRWNKPILDTSKTVSRELARLSAHYTANEHLTDDELVRHTAMMLNAIRNNLFHGIKVYDDTDDIQLLELANPLLLKILSRTENLTINP